MNYKLNKIMQDLQNAYYAESITVIDFIQKFQDASDNITRAFKNNKIDMNYYLLYSNNLAALSINNRFTGK